MADPLDPYGEAAKAGDIVYQPEAIQPRINYPDMTPTPGQRTASATPPSANAAPVADPYGSDGILGTSHTRLPSKDDPGQVIPAPVQRIRNAVYDAYYNAPSLGTEPGNMSVLSNATQNSINKSLGPVGGWIANEPGKLAGIVMGGAAAVPAAISSTVSELAREAGMAPSLIRDTNLAATAIPADQIVTGGLSNVRSLAPPSTRLPAAERPIIDPSIPRPPVPGERGPPVIQPLGPEALDTAYARGRVRGLLGDATPGDTSPTGIAPPMAPPEGFPPPAKPTASAPAFATSQQLYDLADDKAAAGGDYPSTVTNSHLNNIKAQMPQGPWGTATGGTDAVTDLYNRSLAVQDQAMSGADALATDQRLTKLIHDETDPVKGVSDTGRRLGIIQDQFRAMTDSPEQVQARLAWQQAEKMKTVEQMNDKAQGTQNPTASIKTQVNGLINNQKASAGWSDAEKAAVQNWAERGNLGSVMYSLGSRLTPVITRSIAAGGGTLAGALTGDWASSLVPAFAGGAVMDAGSAFARELSNAMSQQRMQKALEVLGKSAPDAPPRPASPFVATMPGAAATPPPTGTGSVLRSIPGQVAPGLMEAIKRLSIAQAPGQQPPPQVNLAPEPRGPVPTITVRPQPQVNWAP